MEKEPKSGEFESKGFEEKINKYRDKDIIISYSGEKTLYGRKDYRGMTFDQLVEKLPRKFKDDFLSCFESLKTTESDEIQLKDISEIGVIDQGANSIVLDCDKNNKRVVVYYLDSGGMATFPKDDYFQE